MPRRKRRTQSAARKRILRTQRLSSREKIKVTVNRRRFEQGRSNAVPLLRTIPPNAPAFRSKQRENLAAGAQTGAYGAFVGRAGLHVLRAEGNAPDLLTRVEAGGRNARNLPV